MVHPIPKSNLKGNIVFVLFITVLLVGAVYAFRDESARLAHELEEAHQRTLELTGSYHLIVDNLESYTVIFLNDGTAFIKGMGGVTHRVDVTISATGEYSLPTIAEVIFTMEGSELFTFEVETQSHNDFERTVNAELSGALRMPDGSVHDSFLVR